MTKLKSIRVAGWKSIKDSERIELGAQNIFIGANGSGKSNLVSFFKLLNAMSEERLQEFIGTSGGANSVLHYGAKVTPILKAKLEFEAETGTTAYYVTLVNARVDTLIFRDETGIASSDDPNSDVDTLIFREESVDSREHPGFLNDLRGGLWHPKIGPRESVWETVLAREAKRNNNTAKVARQLFASCRVYHFHDTSESSPVRRRGYVNNNRFLMPDGGNLAAMLYRFKESESTSESMAYDRIVNTIRQVAPFFGDFDLEPLANDPSNILLNWRERGVDQPFSPAQLSDGTLRVMALTTLLLQPEGSLPAVIVIDEPELGLHPFAIGVLASLVKKAAHHCQVILATQSPEVVDQFEREDIIVVDRKDKESCFTQWKSKDQLDAWLDEYTLSEVWEKNVFGGGPH